MSSSSSMAAGLNSGEPQEIKATKRNGWGRGEDFHPAELLLLTESHQNSTAALFLPPHSPELLSPL